MNFEKISQEQHENKKESSLAERLKDFWSEHYPDILEKNLEEQKEATVEYRARENAVADKEIVEALEQYGFEGVSLYHDYTLVDYENADGTAKVIDDVYRIPHYSHATNTHNERLPEGYAFSGGAARAELLRALGIDSEYEPRDLDVVRTSPEEPFTGLDQTVSENFMPEDFSHGNGVRAIGDEQVYFRSRDLTQNEVLATGDTVIATRSAILDTARRVIRPTSFERMSFNEDADLGPKMLSKILRFYSQSIERYGDGRIEGVESKEFETAFISPFWLALQLDRSYEVNENVAERYTEELRQHGQIPDDIENAEQAAAFLGELVSHFSYRYAPSSQFTQERAWADEKTKIPTAEEIGEEYEDILKRVGKNDSRLKDNQSIF